MLLQQKPVLESKRLHMIVISEYITEVMAIEDKMTYEEAAKHALTLGINWRLPCVGELMLIQKMPPKDVFLNTSGIYWSMDDHPSHNDKLMNTVGMKYGFSYYKYKDMKLSVCFVKYKRTTENVFIREKKKNNRPPEIKVKRIKEGDNCAPNYKVDLKRVVKIQEV